MLQKDDRRFHEIEDWFGGTPSINIIDNDVVFSVGEPDFSSCSQYKIILNPALTDKESELYKDVSKILEGALIPKRATVQELVALFACDMVSMGHVNWQKLQDREERWDCSVADMKTYAANSVLHYVGGHWEHMIQGIEVRARLLKDEVVWHDDELSRGVYANKKESPNCIRESHQVYN